MGFGIMRIEKRARTDVYGLQIEANRTKEDHAHGRDFARSDIDWSKTEENVTLRYCENWNREITQQISDAGLQARKNSIVLLDGVYTASADFFHNKSRDEVIQYFQDCLQFHEREYGRVINAVIHFDEMTPHMQVASVPIIVDEKGAHLSAKIIMGNQQKYRARQDRFYESVSKRYGLERGEVRDAAETKEHLTKREWQLATQEERAQSAEARAQRANTAISMLEADISALEDEKAELEAQVKAQQDAEARAAEAAATAEAARAEADRLATSAQERLEEYRREEDELTKRADGAKMEWSAWKAMKSPEFKKSFGKYVMDEATKNRIQDGLAAGYKAYCDKLAVETDLIDLRKDYKTQKAIADRVKTAEGRVDGLERRIASLEQDVKDRDEFLSHEGLTRNYTVWQQLAPYDRQYNEFLRQEAIYDNPYDLSAISNPRENFSFSIPGRNGSYGLNSFLRAYGSAMQAAGVQPNQELADRIDKAEQAFAHRHDHDRGGGRGAL